MDIRAYASTNPGLFRLVWLLERELRAGEPVGTAASPRKERIHFRQFPHFYHAPTDVAGFTLPEHASAQAQIDCYATSLIGPNGPLPHFVTEQAIQERLAGGPRPLGDLLDMVGGRFIELLYRAWTIGTPAYALEDARMACAYRGAMAAVHGPAPTPVGPSQREQVSWFLGYPRSRAFLKHLLQDAFGLPVDIVQFIGAWLAIPKHARSRLGVLSAKAGLGTGIVIGSRTWDRRYRIRICFRGGSFPKYLGFLPGAPLRTRLDALVRSFARSHLEWDVDYELPVGEIPTARFGSGLRLGFTYWLGKPRHATTCVRLPKALFNAASPSMT